jgi:hypothetical protein
MPLTTGESSVVGPAKIRTLHRVSCNRCTAPVETGHSSELRQSPSTKFAGAAQNPVAGSIGDSQSRIPDWGPAKKAESKARNPEFDTLSACHDILGLVAE